MSGIGRGRNANERDPAAPHHPGGHRPGRDTGRGPDQPGQSLRFVPGVDSRTGRTPSAPRVADGTREADGTGVADGTREADGLAPRTDGASWPLAHPWGPSVPRPRLGAARGAVGASRVAVRGARVQPASRRRAVAPRACVPPRTEAPRPPLGRRAVPGRWRLTPGRPHARGYAAEPPSSGRLGVRRNPLARQGTPAAERPPAPSRFTPAAESPRPGPTR